MKEGKLRKMQAFISNNNVNDDQNKILIRENSINDFKNCSENSFSVLRKTD